LGENEELYVDVGAKMLQVLADVTLERHMFILICYVKSFKTFDTKKTEYSRQISSKIGRRNQTINFNSILFLSAVGIEI
jgi:uncharacterized membrane-anchored protein YjiN (DUF445 family)